jgi:Glycosyltransferase family 87
MRWPLAAALALLAAALIAPSAAADEHPANQPPFGGEKPPPLVEPDSQSEPPPGFGLSAADAIDRAAATAVVRDELAESPDATPTAYLRGERWQVSYRHPDGTEVAQVILNGQTGAVEEAWRDHQVETKLARGYDGAVAQKVNAPYVWLPLCMLFLAPFFDPRRPLRLVHLDLLVLVGLGLSLLFFNRAEIDASVALTYPVLVYFLVRMLVAGLWPRTRPGPLIPFFSTRVLLVGLIALLAARIVLNVVDSHVIDVGVAGVIGADRITGGEPLYEGAFSPGIDLRGDVYGPANYLAYVPFELVFPWHGAWDDVPAAHAAAIAFDLLSAAGLFLLGRRLRPGDEGAALGLALAFAWAACPWTLYAMNANANDALVAALGIGALLALRSPPLRGAMVALATAAKFGSAALAPLFATADGERRWRSALWFSVAFVAVGALLVVPFLPEGGVREFYDRTLGYQATRNSPFSVWGLAPSLDFLQPVARVAAAALAIGVALHPRFKTPIQIAALACAVTIAVQLTATHWFYFYVVWFLPFALVASFGQLERVRRFESPAARAAAS